MKPWFIVCSFFILCTLLPNFTFGDECPDPSIKFHLFHNDSMESDISTNLDPSLPTKIIIHGFSKRMNVSALVELRNAYLTSRTPVNVVAVDWSNLTRDSYSEVVKKVPHVAECIALKIRELRDRGVKDLHAIGFSLGAQVLAHSAIYLRPYKIPRITGLDPAKPSFDTDNIDEKLDESDAEFVDVYHTNAYLKGQSSRNGHVDFFFNVGVMQPGCFWADFTKKFMSCSHNRAAQYFAESIDSEEGFWGRKCEKLWRILVNGCPNSEDIELAGEHVNKNLRGSYIVKTKSSKPYAKGKNI